MVVRAKKQHSYSQALLDLPQSKIEEAYFPDTWNELEDKGERDVKEMKTYKNKKRRE